MSTTVVVDAWHLGGASANRGIGTYLRGILPLLADDSQLNIVALAEEPAVLPAGVRYRHISRLAPNRFAQREHDVRLPHDLSRAARAESADVIFSPADNPPRRSRLPWVQMLHDVIPLTVNDPMFAGGARRWQHIGPRLRNAQFVCTNSEQTAADATRFFGLDSARLRVIPLGVDSRFRPPDTRATTSPTVLYVGEYGPHKGFAEAFAVAGAIAEAGLPHRVAMVGFLAPWYEPVVRDLLARAPRPDRIDFLGYVDDIVAAYQQADALIVTSRYEGFCLPALEAMACGCPVVAFANSAIPETVGDAGVLVPDGDVRELASALGAILGDSAVRSEWSARGVAHARSFTWARCAAAQADVFRMTAGAPGR